jgi:hypothetical protein
MNDSERKRREAIEEQLEGIVGTAVAVEFGSGDLARTILTTPERILVWLDGLYDRAWKDGRKEGWRQSRASKSNAGHSSFAPAKSPR